MSNYNKSFEKTMNDRKLLDFYLNSINNIYQHNSLLFTLGADNEIIETINNCCQVLEDNLYKYQLECMAKIKDESLREIESDDFLKSIKRIAKNISKKPTDGNE